jgi:hypothetical protein
MAQTAMNFVEGALWSEAGAGTNAIGTVLATDHAVQVHAAEHFSEVVHGWTCSAVPARGRGADSAAIPAPTWSGWRDLNPRPLAPKASALPSCATPRPAQSMRSPHDS